MRVTGLCRFVQRSWNSLTLIPVLKQFLSKSMGSCHLEGARNWIACHQAFEQSKPLKLNLPLLKTSLIWAEKKPNPGCWIDWIPQWCWCLVFMLELFTHYQTTNWMPIHWNIVLFSKLHFNTRYKNVILSQKLYSSHKTSFQCLFPQNAPRMLVPWPLPKRTSIQDIVIIIQILHAIPCSKW